jgi:hypothetical protein
LKPADPEPKGCFVNSSFGGSQNDPLKPLEAERTLVGSPLSDWRTQFDTVTSLGGISLAGLAVLRAASRRLRLRRVAASISIVVVGGGLLTACIGDADTYLSNAPACAPSPQAPSPPAAGTRDWVSMTVAACPPPASDQYASSMFIGGVPSVIVFGGKQRSPDGGSGGERGDTWSWDGTHWHEIPNSVAPVLDNAAIAYDPIHNQVVMFGGFESAVPGQGEYSDITWTFDGTSWTEHDPTAAGIPQPPARGYEFMSTDPGHGVFMFGGQNGHLMNDAWEWDGVRWHLKQAEDDAVSCTSMVRPCGDAVRTTGDETGMVEAAPNAGDGIIVLPGLHLSGTTEDYSDLRTWVWTGSSWTVAAASTPIFNPQGPDHAYVVYSGGADYLFGNGKEYAWNGSVWTQVTTAHLPATRDWPALAGLPAAGTSPDRIVLFGGQKDPEATTRTYMDDTWEQYAAPATTIANSSQFSATTYTATASSTQVLGTVTRTGNTSAGAQIDVAAHDGTAHNGTDYTLAAPVHVPFAAGQTSAGFGIDVTHGSTAKQFTVSLQSPSDTTIGTPSTATVTIDAAPSSGGGGSGGFDWTATTTPFGPGPRQAAAMASWTPPGDTAGQLGAALFSGQGNFTPGATSSLLDDTWVYQSTAWAQLLNTCPAPQTLAGCANWPSARTMASMTYDAQSKTTVLFGGQDASGNALDDTWLLQGTTWTQVPRSASFDWPSARQDASFADELGTDGVLLFGGKGPHSDFNDTWIFNVGSKQWNLIAASASPSMREGAIMTVNPIKSGFEGLVLFGGLDPSSNVLHDTWIFNGTEWNVVADPCPTLSIGCATRPDQEAAIGQASYMPYRTDTAFVYSGFGAATWMWNGTAWSKVTTAASPGHRFGGAGVVEIQDGSTAPMKLLLYGGSTTDATTWIFGSTS